MSNLVSNQRNQSHHIKPIKKIKAKYNNEDDLLAFFEILHVPEIQQEIEDVRVEHAEKAVYISLKAPRSWSEIWYRFMAHLHSPESWNGRSRRARERIEVGSDLRLPIQQVILADQSPREVAIPKSRRTLWQKIQKIFKYGIILVRRHISRFRKSAKNKEEDEEPKTSIIGKRIQKRRYTRQLPCSLSTKQEKERKQLFKLETQQFANNWLSAITDGYSINILIEKALKERDVCWVCDFLRAHPQLKKMDQKFKKTNANNLEKYHLF